MKLAQGTKKDERRTKNIVFVSTFEFSAFFLFQQNLGWTKAQSHQAAEGAQVIPIISIIVIVVIIFIIIITIAIIIR